MSKSILTTVLLLFVAVIHSMGQKRADVDLAVNKFQTLYNNKQPESIFNMFSDRMKTLMPLDKTTETMTKLNSQLGEMRSYSYTKKEQHLSYYKATFDNAALTMVVSLDKEDKLETLRFVPYKDEDAAPAEKSNFTYRSNDGDIYGSLVLPDGNKPVPAVLIIAGSGPTDRNGNQDGIKASAYKMLADSLQKAGIATVRYDKRGIAESEKAMQDESKLTFDDMVDDATGFIRMMKKDRRFSAVFVLGHSEGSLVGMLAAAKEPVKGYISVAGIAERADKIIVRQIAAQSEELSLKAAFIMDSMSKGHAPKNIGPELSGLFRPSVQPYIKSWLKYEPRTEIQKLNIPVLILQGTTDLQVATEEAQKLKDAYPRATLKIIEGMNHTLKQAPADREKNMATYANPSLPLSPGSAFSISTFVKANAK